MKPILFSTPMVQAILAGHKTMTRRVITNKDYQLWVSSGFSDKFIKDPENKLIEKAPIKSGDILWVRETYKENMDGYTGQRFGGVVYKADSNLAGLSDQYNPWKPSIFMPKAVARIFLRVTEVRAERIQDITQQDAIDEGALLYDGWETKEYKEQCAVASASGTKPPLGFSPRERFEHLWNKLNAARGYGWDTNPWVWVYTFERLTREETQA